MERAAGGARVCAGACGRTTARPPPRSRSALSVRRAVVSPLQPRRRGRRARCSARRLPEEREPPGPSRPPAAPPPPSHAATAAVSFCATRRSCSLPPTRLRRRCVLRCDPPRWQQRALLVPLPASGPGATPAVGVARSPLAWRRAAGRAAAQSAASSAARRAVLVLASARALKACSTACPLHYLYARGGSQSWRSPSQSCQSPSQPSHTVCLRLPWSKCRSRGLPAGKDPPRPSRNCYLAERGGAA